MVTREEGLPEELLALMDDMKNAQKRANQVRYLPTLNRMISNTKKQNHLKMIRKFDETDFVCTGQW